MPKVKYTDNQGLHQVNGTGVHLKNAIETISAAGDHDLSSIDGNTLVFVNTALADGNDITLPQATVANAGIIIRVFLNVDTASGGTIRLGYTNAGSTKIQGITSLFTNAASEADGSHMPVLSNAKVFLLDDNNASTAGAKGSYFEFYYTAADTVMARVRGISGAATPNLTDSTFASATGIS